MIDEGLKCAFPVCNMKICQTSMIILGMHLGTKRMFIMMMQSLAMSWASPESLWCLIDMQSTDVCRVLQ